MNIKDIISVNVEIDTSSKTRGSVIIRANECVDGENPFKSPDILLNGEEILGREFKLDIFSILKDNKMGYTYKMTVNPTSYVLDLKFVTIHTFDKNDCIIDDFLITGKNVVEMSLNTAESYGNKLFYNFSYKILMDMLEKYNYLNDMIRSVGERYSFNHIPIIADSGRIFTNSGFKEIQTIHDGEIVEYGGEYGLCIIDKPSFIISIEKEFLLSSIGDFYEPEPTKLREVTVDTSKSLYKAVKEFSKLVSSDDIEIW